MIARNFGGDVEEDDLPRWWTLLGREIHPERAAAVHVAGFEVDWKTVADAWNVPVLCDETTGEVLRRRAEPQEPENAPDDESADNDSL